MAGPSENGGLDVAMSRAFAGGGYAVTPLTGCDHTAALTHPEQIVADVQVACAACGNVGENMLCLQCGEVRCGRHVKGHMLEHTEATGHPLVCGFADLSFWCYGCDAYVHHSNPKLAPYYHALHLSKFGTAPPAA